MNKAIDILEHGSIYFFYRPHTGLNSIEAKSHFSRFLMVLEPFEAIKRYRLAILAKDSIPSEVDHDMSSCFAFVDLVTSSKDALAQALKGNRYSPRDHESYPLPVAEEIADGKYLITTHQGCTFFSYKLKDSYRRRSFYQDHALNEEGAYLAFVKNPCHPTPTHQGLDMAKKAHYPKDIQLRFGNERILPLSPDHLNYDGAEFFLMNAHSQPDHGFLTDIWLMDPNFNFKEIISTLEITAAREFLMAQEMQHPTVILFESKQLGSMK